MRIGYFLPEFPGQTHIFFWRELQVLESLGFEVEIVSTRQPAAAIMSHTWTAEAQARTTYLFPPSQAPTKILAELFRAGPLGWWRCLQALVQAEGLSLKGRLRLAALTYFGAELAAIARDRRWQHIHIHSCADAAHVGMLAFLLSGLPYSLTLHGDLGDYGPNQAQKWRYARFAIVITQRLYREVHQLLVGDLPSQVQVAPMGVDCDVLQRSSPYLAWNGISPCQIFSCGRLNPCKGHADLIQAIALLQQRGILAQLAIAGEDEQGGTGYHRELTALIQQLGLQDSVQLLGAVSEGVIRQQLEQAHVFALASAHEPLGIATAEAMAMAMPVVATGGGGVRELIEDGQDGLLIQPGDPTAIAKALEQILCNPDLALKLSQNSRQKIQDKFHHRRSAEVLAACLDSGQN